MDKRNYSSRGRLVQSRVLTNCPLCGFRQRIDRLTGLEFQVEDMEDLLPLEVAAVYYQKGRYPGPLHCELLPINLKPEIRQEMLFALAVKMLPIVLYLQGIVPEFREAISDVTEVERDREVRIQIDRPGTVDRIRNLERELAGARAQIQRFKEVKTWRKVEVERGVPVTWKQNWPKSGNNATALKNDSQPLSRERKIQREITVPVETPRGGT